MSIELAESFRGVVFQLYVLLEVTRSPTHSKSECRAAADQLAVACSDVLGVRDTLTIEGRGAGLFVNGVRACFDLRVFAAVEGVVLALRQCRVRWITIEKGVTVEELIQLAELMSDAELVVVPDYFEEQLFAKTPHIRATPADSVSTTGSGVQSSALRSVYVAKHLIDCAVDDKEIPPKFAQETLKGIADLVLTDGSLLSLLTDLQALGSEVMRRSAQTCLLSVMLGRRIGLPEVILGELGVAALFRPLARDTGELDLLDRLLVLDPSDLALRVIHLVCHCDSQASDEDIAGVHSLEGGILPSIVRLAESRARPEDGSLVAGIPQCLAEAFAETIEAAQLQVDLSSPSSITT